MRKNIIERAFELAHTGQFRTTSEVLQALKREHYEGVELTFAGRELRRAIKLRIENAWKV